MGKKEKWNKTCCTLLSKGEKKIGTWELAQAFRPRGRQKEGSAGEKIEDVEPKSRGQSKTRARIPMGKKGREEN